MLNNLQLEAHCSDLNSFQMEKERLSAPEEYLLNQWGSWLHSGLHIHIIVEPIGLWLRGALIRFAKGCLGAKN